MIVVLGGREVGIRYRGFVSRIFRARELRERCSWSRGGVFFFILNLVGRDFIYIVLFRSES